MRGRRRSPRPGSIRPHMGRANNLRRMNKAELDSKHLSELHALAADAGVERYRMLPRAELIEKLADSGGGGSAGGGGGSSQRNRAPRERKERSPRGGGRDRQRGGRDRQPRGGGGDRQARG